MRKHLAVVIPLLLAPAAVPAASHTVELIDHEFVPENLTIQTGDQVTWINREDAFHNVIAEDGSFRCADGCQHLGGNSAPAIGWRFTLTFNQPGDVPYYCQPHRSTGMTGTLKVVGEPQEEPPPETIAVNYGHTGSWYNPDTDGQGFNIEVVLDDGKPAQVVVYWFTFSNSSEGANKLGVNDQRWFIGVGDVPAQGHEIELEVFISGGGGFNAPTPVPQQDSVGTATLAFESCTEGLLAYDIDLLNDEAQHVSGEIPIKRLTPDSGCAELVNR